MSDVPIILFTNSYKYINIFDEKEPLSLFYFVEVNKVGMLPIREAMGLVRRIVSNIIKVRLYKKMNLITLLRKYPFSSGNKSLYS